MADKCIYCKKKKAAEPKTVSFEYGGFKFFSFKDGSTCEECEKKEVIRRFNEFGRKFISLKDGKVKVNWKFYSRAYWKEGDNSLIRVLQDLGIFSFNSKGNWEIRADGSVSLNPIKTAGTLYFTREEDVVEFARLNYLNTLYNWQIKQTGKVITRKEIEKRKGK